jgi:methionine-R-sulfoxide reductase
VDQRDKLKSSLSPLQFEVICNNATEPPFNNEYWNESREGVYVDRVTNTPLFLSVDKYDSGSGWPSFVKPIDLDQIVENADHSLGMKRIEVRSKVSDAHLGHVFDDGPIDRGGLRYCINSAALRFIPKEDLAKEGLESLLHYFKS